MLLSHTSGYQDYWPEDYVMTSMMAPTTAAHILEVWGKKPLDFDPGTKWQYSNTNFVIAGKIVEQVSGMPLMQFLESRVFTPLGMRDVYDSDARALPPTDPLGYYRHALGPLRPAPQEGAGWMFAAGELAMPPRDLALWDISLIDRSLLKPASYAEMFAPVPLKSGASTGYGLGLFISSRDGHAMLEHSGEVSGFVSENVVFPADHAAIAVLTNETPRRRQARSAGHSRHWSSVSRPAAQRQERPGRRKQGLWPSSSGWKRGNSTARGSRRIAMPISRRRRWATSPAALRRSALRSALPRARKRAVEG